MRVGVVAILCTACASPAAPPAATVPVVANTATTETKAVSVSVHYATYGLMPAPICGSPSYRIDIVDDDTGPNAVSCGWTSSCPPYSAEHQLLAAPHGHLAPDAAARLDEEARRPDFATLKSNMNPHIIDGGERDLTVNARRVEMVNITDPVFERFLAALARETGCSSTPTTPPPR